jgi:hypothetical protein
MKAATIVPTPLLYVTDNDDYFMALANVACRDERYTRFFRRKSQEGKFVIMDNGAAEGDQKSLMELMDIAYKLQPAEVVLPDELYDKDETLKKSKEALAVMKDWLVPYGFMGVPHGKTQGDWVECAKVMLEWPINCIGVSKFLTEQFGPDARMWAIQTLYELMIQQKCVSKSVHLLGCWATPTEIRDIEKMFPGFVRGTDSAIGFVYAANRLPLNPDIPRPHFEIDFHRSIAPFALVDANARAWRYYANGKLQ